MSESETARTAIALAKKHRGKGRMPDSAELCIQDALELLVKGDDYHAADRALTSLGYSVGHCHPDYQRVLGLMTAGAR